MGNKKSFRRGCESSAKFFNEPAYFFSYFILTYTIQDSKSIFLQKKKPPPKWRRFWRDEKENFCRLTEKHECQRGKGRN